MSKNFVLFLIFIVCISCRKPLATFQPSRNSTYAKKPITTKMDGNEKKMATSETEQSESSKPVQKVINAIKNDYSEIKTKTKSKLESQKNSRAESNKSFQKKAKNEKQKSKTKHQRRNPRLNDSLIIGFVFLALAIGIAFFHVSQLIWLFGLAAIFFLYLGLKKYLVAKRIKKFFNKFRR